MPMYLPPGGTGGAVPADQVTVAPAGGVAAANAQAAVEELDADKASALEHLAHLADEDNPHAVTKEQVGLSSSDGLPEGSTNLYHTVARVRDAILTGLSTASSAVITAADSVLSALGKLQPGRTTGTGAATIVTATGLTLVGSMAVANATSARFRVRKTAANTFTVYRV